MRDEREREREGGREGERKREREREREREMREGENLLFKFGVSINYILLFYMKAE